MGLACSQESLGYAGEFVFDPGIDPEARVMQRPTPLPPHQREWVKQELEKQVRMGVLRPVASCKCAVNVVLVEQGQTG